MIQVPLFLLVAFVSMADCTKNCPISGRNTDGLTACDGQEGDQRCYNYCRLTFGTNESKCDGPKGKCICYPHCGVAQVHGDPHVKTFDGIRFTSQSLCSYIAIKSVQPSKYFPQFELHFQNEPGLNNFPISYPSAAKLMLPEWGLELELNARNLKLQVNGYAVQFPFIYTTRFNGVENYLAAFQSEYHMNITTNFGLHIHLYTPYLYWRDFTVYMAKTPQFIGNLAGLLGNLDGHPHNDVYDRFEVPRNPASTSSMEAYARSWCIDGIEGSLQEEEEANRQRDAKIHDCTMNESKRIDDLCARLENHALLKTCLHEEEMATAKRECFLDVCFLTGMGQTAEIQAVEGIVEAYEISCLSDE